MRRTPRAILLLSTLLMLAAPAIPARADVAPPENPQSGNLLPGHKTKVQMVSEDVVMDMPAMESEFGAYTVGMTATFHMVNQGKQTETMRVGFPMDCNSYNHTDYSASIDGNPVEVMIEDGPAIVLPLPFEYG